MTENDLQILLEKGETAIRAKDFAEALNCYDQLIEHAPPNSYFYHQRSYVNQLLDNVDHAIRDMNAAVKLDPDRADYWWSLGALESYKLSIDTCIENPERKKLLEEIKKAYRKAIELNPSDQVPWLDCIEMSLISSQYDEAISLYGECKPYISSKEHKLIRAWLGCLALIFAGDEINEEDYEPLTDESIVLNRTHWRAAEINRFLDEVRANPTMREPYKKAVEIHSIFLSHFSEPPW